MIMDERLEFADALALNTGGADNYLLGDVIDTGGDGINDVDDIYLVIQVATTVDSAGDGVTLQFHLASDAGAAVDPDTGTRHLTTPVFAQATLVAGYRYAAHLPRGTYERYLGLIQTTAVEAATAGAIDAFLTRTPPSWMAFPDASN